MMQFSPNLVLKYFIASATKRTGSHAFDTQAVEAKLVSARKVVFEHLNVLQDKLDNARAQARKMPLDESIKTVRLRAPIATAFETVRANSTQALKCTADGLREQGKTTRATIAVVEDVQAILERDISQVHASLVDYEMSIDEKA